VKWAVADQINGRSELNFVSAQSPVRAPWIAWGPYLWTDGTKGRADGFVWQREDCGPDGTHPSDSGRVKVADQLLKFLKSEASAQPWFLKRTP
jgi:lysophospholipase L1-like esterase